LRLEVEEEPSHKLTLRQPWVWSVSDFIFLDLAYEGGWWPVLHRICASTMYGQHTHHDRVI